MQVEVIISTPVEYISEREIIDLVSFAAEAALESEYIRGPKHITVLLGNNEDIKSLNLKFNGLDQVTDVLSFNQNDGWENGVPPQTDVDPFQSSGEDLLLGEIIISLPQVRKQAKQNNVAPRKELAMLIIHGILHLLGYDHAKELEKKIMFNKTSKILDKVTSFFSSSDFNFAGI